MVVVTFDKLYENYNTLTEAKDNVGEFKSEFMEVIDSTKGDTKMKLLSAKIIPTFFKHFPSLQLLAVEAVIDMCECDDSKVRCAAMRALPPMCKYNKEFVSKVADILAQLLQLEDQAEYLVASSGLMQLLEDDIVTVIKCIFLQIHESENVAREKCIKFFITKIKTVEKSLLTLEVEDLIILEIKKILQDASGEEFAQLMSYLVSTKFANNFTGMQEIVDIAAEQAELDQDFDPSDEECNNADRFITCTRFVLPFFSVKINSSRFVKYITDQILPKWSEVRTECKHHILQQLAELSPYCGSLENASLHVVQIFDRIKHELPEPPEQTESSKDEKMPVYDFTVCESLLFAFHALARQCKDFLTHDPAVLKEFRARLMYCARAVQGCLNVIHNVNKDKVLTPEERKKKEIAPLMLNNINALIRDLFYQPPQYKCKVTLSFKKPSKQLPTTPKEPQATETTSGASKRHKPITFSSNGSTSGKQPRPNRSGENLQIYAPPSGKFSNSFHSYGDRNMGMGRGGRGGRGRGRGWRN